MIGARKSGKMTYFEKESGKEKRDKILKLIEENIGVRLIDITRYLNYNESTTKDHVRRLRAMGLIKQGADKLYYSMDVKPVDLTYPQRRIMLIIKENPSIRPIEISNTLGRSKEFVNYHLKILEYKGTIKKEKSGKETHCYVVNNKIELN